MGLKSRLVTAVRSKAKAMCRLSLLFRHSRFYPKKGPVVIGLAQVFYLIKCIASTLTLYNFYETILHD